MLNNVVLMGRICTDLELKHTQSEISVTTFRLAVDRDFSKEKQTDFINIICWRKTAEFVTKYFTKGNMIALTGRLQTRQYKAKDGSNRYATEVIADSVSFTGEKNNSVKEDNNEVNSFPSDFQEIVDDDDLPF